MALPHNIKYGTQSRYIQFLQDTVATFASDPKKRKGARAINDALAYYAQFNTKDELLNLLNGLNRAVGAAPPPQSIIDFIYEEPPGIFATKNYSYLRMYFSLPETGISPLDADALTRLYVLIARKRSSLVYRLNKLLLKQATQSSTA